MNGVVCRDMHQLRIPLAASIYCVVCIFSFTIGYCAPISPQETPQRTAIEKKEMVQTAVAHFHQGKIVLAKETLEGAETDFPENYAVPYYLGLISLKQGHLEMAIAQWQRYLKIAPQSDNALKIRKYLTVLIRRHARQYAKQVLAEEFEIAVGPADEHTIAVTTFNNLGSDHVDSLGKGMAAMLITDLTQVPNLHVVDRIKLHILLEEMKLGTTGLVDIKNAPKVGKLLKAKHVTTGSLADLENEGLIIASTVMDAEQQASIGAQTAQGKLNQFYQLEKKIACNIIEDLGRDCDAVPVDFHKIHTKSMPAFIWYSRGLDAFDREDYDDARQKFQKALDHDPQFELAIIALSAIPTATILSMGHSQIIATASSSGPSSAAAGSAVAGTTGSGSAVAASAATGSVGISPMTAIIAGVATVGGGAVLAGGSGSSSGGNNPPQRPSKPFSLTGDWSGSWTDGTGTNGEATFFLTQTDDEIQGTVSITGDKCLSTGDISGTVTGTSVDLTIRSGSQIIALSGKSDNTAKTMSGTWHNTESATPNCASETGRFSTTLTTGGARIRW